MNALSLPWAHMRAQLAGQSHGPCCRRSMTSVASIPVTRVHNKDPPSLLPPLSLLFAPLPPSTTIPPNMPAINLPEILLQISRNPVVAVGLPLVLGMLSGSPIRKASKSSWYNVCRALYPCLVVPLPTNALHSDRVCAFHLARHHIKSFRSCGLLCI